MKPSVLSLHPLLRQGHEHSPRPSLPTGHAVLDAALHEHGWPLGALTELLTSLPGMGELRLLAPSLKQALELPGWLVLVTPPGVPHAPAWLGAGLPTERLLVLRPDNPRDWLWSVDQAARAGMPAVLAWPGRVSLTGKHLRRLQLAAEEGGRLLVISRRPGALEEASPAALRLLVEPQGPRLRLDILKQRGSWGGQAVHLPLPFAENPPPPLSEWCRPEDEATPPQTVGAPQLSLVG